LPAAHTLVGGPARAPGSAGSPGLRTAAPRAGRRRRRWYTASRVDRAAS
jgi:hypothetical protein